MPSPLLSSRSPRALRSLSLVPIALLVFACASACSAETSAGGTCGNGILEPSEECEAFDLRHQTCDSVGLQIGQLRCSADCKLDTIGCGGRCGDGIVQPGEACDGTNLNGATCSSALGAESQGTLGCSSDCRSLLTETCRGQAPQGALTACVPGSSTCAAPTSCVTITSGSFCIEPCDLNAAATCGAGRYCEDVGGGGACASVPAAGMGCTTRSGCLDPALSCIPTFTGKTATISTCAAACSAADVGRGQASCASGKSCVAVEGGPLEIEKPAPCAVPTEASDCTTAQGYRCRSITTAGATAMRCARAYGQCAPVTPLYKFDGAPIVDALLCDRTQPTRGPAKCGLVSATPLTNPARVECVAQFPGLTELGVCVAYCDGVVLARSTAGIGPDGECGEGATCKVPNAPDYFLPQSDALAACTDVDRASCGPQFDRCLDLGRGLECARAVRICVGN